MRVIWKDSLANPCPTTKYRNIEIIRYKKGWILGIDGNTNIYASQDCAKNAIDEILGGTPRRHVEKRLLKGIKIIGTKDAAS